MNNAIRGLSEIIGCVKIIYDRMGPSAFTEVAQKNGRQVLNAMNDFRFEAVLNKQQL